MRSYGTIRFPLDGFSRDLAFEYFFSKICPENSSFIKIGKEKRELCVKTNIRLSSYLAQFFLEWKSSTENQNTHVEFNNFFLWDIVEKYDRSGRPQMKMWRMRFTCWLSRATNTLSEHVILTVFPLQKYAQTRLNITLYVYCLYCFLY